MQLDYFDFSLVLSVAEHTQEIKHDTERRLRLLGAAEYAASELTSSGALAPIAVTEAHWRWACQYTICALGELPSCFQQPSKTSEIPLWSITVFPGYMQKLALLGYGNPEILGKNFVQATTELKDYMNKYAYGKEIVDSGALLLHSSTWETRLKLLGVEVAEHGPIELPSPKLWAGI